ncbi:MAG: hypothetical protein AMXMBFR36_24600 [Acidobacteriota bacterium]
MARRRGRIEQRRRRPVEQAHRAGRVGGEQVTDVAGERRILALEAPERRGARLGGALGELEEELGQPAMALRGTTLRGRARGPFVGGRDAALRAGRIRA